MRAFIIFGAVVGLILTIVPSFLVFFGVISWESHANLMTAGMIVWFASASWYRKPTQQQ
jgi:hypothetical protein